MANDRQAQGMGALVRDLADGSAALVRKEIKLARLEVAETASNAARGTAMVAMGAVFALLGSLALLVGFVLLVGDQWLPADQYWLAALLVTLLAGGVAAWAAMRGKRWLSPRELVPDETIETLKEDKEWLKRQMTSGATSS